MVAVSYSRGSSRPRDQTHVSYISYTGRQILYQLHHLNVFSPHYLPVESISTHLSSCFCRAYRGLLDQR